MSRYEAIFSSLRKNTPVEMTPEIANLRTLTLLLRLFRNLSTEPIEDETEFAREVFLRWRLWREQEGWTLKSAGLLDGYFELHLREAVLGVRVFRNNPNADPTCVARLRILLGNEGIVSSAIDLADDPDAKLIAAQLLEAVSYHGPLRPLERSLSRGLSRLVQTAELVGPIRTQESPVHVPKRYDALRASGSSAPPRPTGTEPHETIATSFECCGWCGRLIEPRSTYVERRETRNGMRAEDRWAFCSMECEAAQ